MRRWTRQLAGSPHLRTRAAPPAPSAMTARHGRGPHQFVAAVRWDGSGFDMIGCTRRTATFGEFITPLRTSGPIIMAAVFATAPLSAGTFARCGRPGRDKRCRCASRRPTGRPGGCTPDEACAREAFAAQGVLIDVLAGHTGLRRSRLWPTVHTHFPTVRNEARLATCGRQSPTRPSMPA